jgi:uncharacterized membrane protein YfcA
LVPIVSQRVFLLLLGVPIAVFAITQLSGWTLRNMQQSMRNDMTVGAFAGMLGGLSGVWGPPTVGYLTALNTPKQMQFQVQGVIYLLGAVLLTFAHLGSGVLTGATALFSLCLVPPAMMGMALGMAVQDRMNQESFRRATLLVLLIAGLNLVRRGILA